MHEWRTPCADWVPSGDQVRLVGRGNHYRNQALQEDCPAGLLCSCSESPYLGGFSSGWGRHQDLRLEIAPGALLPHRSSQSSPRRVCGDSLNCSSNCSSFDEAGEPPLPAPSRTARTWDTCMHGILGPRPSELDSEYNCCCDRPNQSINCGQVGPLRIARGRPRRTILQFEGS